MKSIQQEFRCHCCHHLLGKYVVEQGSFSLFIKCRKCKTLNATTLHASTQNSHKAV